MIRGLKAPNREQKKYIGCLVYSYSSSVAHPRKSGTKFTFSSTNIPPPPSYLSCRLVNERRRTLSETLLCLEERDVWRYHSLPSSYLESSRQLGAPLPRMGVPLCPRYRCFAPWTSLIASTLLLAHVRNSNFGLSAFAFVFALEVSQERCFSCSLRFHDPLRAFVPC